MRLYMPATALCRKRGLMSVARIVTCQSSRSGIAAAQRDGDRVRLLARATAGAPDARAVSCRVALSRTSAGKTCVLERSEDRRIAEKVRLADGEMRGQRVDLRPVRAWPRERSPRIPPRPRSRVPPPHPAARARDRASAPAESAARAAPRSTALTAAKRSESSVRDHDSRAQRQLQRRVIFERKKALKIVNEHETVIELQHP